MSIPYENQPYGGGEVQEDPDEDNLLDFTFDSDGTIRYAGRFAAARRSKIRALRSLMDQVLGGQGGEPALAEALVSLAEAIEGGMNHFRQCARRFPDQVDYCERNVAAYARARAALDLMYAYLEGDPRRDLLKRGYSELEEAVADVDALAAEEGSGA